jgi:hypothetical protein
VSSYSKQLSDKPHDSISIDIFCQGIRNPPASPAMHEQAVIGH